MFEDLTEINHIDAMDSINGWKRIDNPSPEQESGDYSSLTSQNLELAAVYGLYGEPSLMYRPVDWAPDPEMSYKHRLLVMEEVLKGCITFLSFLHDTENIETEAYKTVLWLISLATDRIIDILRANTALFEPKVYDLSTKTS